MAFTVADGTGKADANAYIDASFFKSYHDERGNDYSSLVTNDPGDIEKAIVLATDYIETRWGDRFKGSPEFPDTQFLSFPRKNLYDREGRLIEGIPKRLKQAVAEYALRALSNPLAPDPEQNSSQLQVKSETSKVGPIETTTEYTPNYQFALRQPYPKADRMLKPYVIPGGRVIRG